ncbi:M15 family metallopeptidase [Leptothoe kymatousa]|uniref:M15 family metallopeptidase n=1 Tax=Leptothoe kymatousa TAU-MAC 1615 TaxID=2364775 RepID=A0ABS5Y1S8_9CYAN|nr:M15 family metallopeptidase [Leptothoe kymatousa]MBT9311742.1 M15 family metallopeptidase [Leptothoe kymatousa TAU-MAC 1615]
MADFIDDIPEAQRETRATDLEPSTRASSSFAPWLFLGVAILGLVGAGIWWFKPRLPLVKTPDSPPTSSTTGSAVAAETVGAAPQTAATASAPQTAATASAPQTAAAPQTATAAASTDEANSLLGHRAYDVVDTSTLVSISTNPAVQLQPEVAQQVEEMLYQAQILGIGLDVISGFRSLEDQQYLFFDLKAERGQNTQTRAEVSAPPGYSEHHTGYAVDFIDLAQPATELNADFEDTAAFQWLEENAAYYGFEMSFPKNNAQNVTYEPWHWRYVGNQESLEMFYKDGD